MPIGQAAARGVHYRQTARYLQCCDS